MCTAWGCIFRGLFIFKKAFLWVFEAGLYFSVLLEGFGFLVGTPRCRGEDFPAPAGSLGFGSSSGNLSSLNWYPFAGACGSERQPAVCCMSLRSRVILAMLLIGCCHRAVVSSLPVRCRGNHPRTPSPAQHLPLSVPVPARWLQLPLVSGPA